MIKSGYKTVNEYIDSFPKETRRVLKILRTVIKSSAPKAEEKISYQMPGYVLAGRSLVYFAAWKNHISFYPASSKTLGKFKKELEKYEISKGTVRFSIDKPLPIALIKRITKYRVSENLKKHSN
jgi:uncharacterized protein YdhG (YjbR/CyaY superfamily)